MVNISEIAVFGWGVGGYVALKALAEADDRLHCGVAISPVTSWEIYSEYFL